jgi:short-subunit dehydrogenase
MAPHGIGVSILCPGLVATRIGINVMKLRPDPQPRGQALTPLQQDLRDRARRYGMSPLKVGERVVKGILADEMYIITHPQVRELVEARCRNLLAHFGESADPDLPLDPNWRDLA